MARTKSEKGKQSQKKTDPDGGQGSAKKTTNRDEIRQWVESRGGKPACVKGTGGKGDEGLLRIDFPGFSGEGTLEEIGWDEFFRIFDENGLEFLFQDEGESRFNKFVSRKQQKAA